MKIVSRSKRRNRYKSPVGTCRALFLMVTLIALAIQGPCKLLAQGTQPELSTQQQRVADRFVKLEALLLRSAELESSENPTRAALLRQAVQLSKQVKLAESLVEAAKDLDQQRFSEALQRQKSSRANLARILTLLQSENRQERVRQQREQVRRWIEETERLLRMQSSLRGRTEGGQEFAPAAENQRQLEAKAEGIARELAGEDPDSAKSKEGSAGDRAGQDQESQQADGDSAETPAGESQSGESQSGESQSGESQSGESQSGEPQSGEPQSGESQSGESQSGESQSGESQSGESQSGESQSGESQSGESQSGESQSKSGQPPQSPSQRALEEIREAQRKMQEARRELEKSQREGASERQREAEENLRAAVARLEEILRQLREEEIERSLASLETRLRRMLDLQNGVLSETERLTEISGQQPNRQIDVRASQLALEEKKVLSEGQRAYLLLKEEGSSAAFPEALQQINLDAEKVVKRLSDGDVSQLTVFVQKEIITSLEEMVEALIQVQKENQQRKQQQQGGQAPGAQPDEQPLVNQLAELRLVRTLQQRVKNRTDAIAEMLSDPSDIVGQATEFELLEELESLAERQAKIGKVTEAISQAQ